MRGVVKRYGSITAVDGLDLDVPGGTCVGLLGPNGAGKSTTMKTLTAQAIPDEGEIEVLGLRLPEESKAARAQCGVVPQLDNLDTALTVWQNLFVFAHLYRVPRGERRQAVERALAIANLVARRDARVDELSGGMRRRLLIARALVHRPRLLLMDEPTVGLDPQVRQELWALIDALRSEGVSILMSTHYIEEADQLCDRVAIIDHGQIVALDTPAALKRRIRAEEVVRLEIGISGDDRALLERLGKSASIARSERHNGTLAVTAHCASARDFVPSAFDAANVAGATIQHVEVVPVSLEDVFISLTGRALRE